MVLGFCLFLRWLAMYLFQKQIPVVAAAGVAAAAGAGAAKALKHSNSLRFKT